MGDRVIVVMKDSHGYSPGVYLHWGGESALQMLQEAAPQMRAGDASYAAARFCGYAHTQIDGGLSLGLVGAPQPNGTGTIDWKAYSPGDAGVVVVDVLTGNVEAYAGYLAQEIAKNPITLTLGKF